ncbi:hypothetical protein FE257_002188 [Aspergillus nanangensis]|uniref:Serine hydrolase domain-containing protein n=1 Tax=Aspergillus nanangensis TaxID=2582783 RepID=A0AAD4CDB9_ASPNN|nr:hypothetical protein FE257_002188 [Aspergillus nanangensis]
MDGPYAAEYAPDGHARLWGEGDFHHGAVRGLHYTVCSVLAVIEAMGPFAGVMGFSVGAAVAVAVASLLELRHRREELRYQTRHPPLQFVIAFSGFMLRHESYRSLYRPYIFTPMLLFVGELDTVIPEDATHQLAGRCACAKIVPFFGTHHVPQDLITAQRIVEFIVGILGCKPTQPRPLGRPLRRPLQPTTLETILENP